MPLTHCMAQLGILQRVFYASHSHQSNAQLDNDDYNLDEAQVHLTIGLNSELVTINLIFDSDELFS